MFDDRGGANPALVVLVIVLILVIVFVWFFWLGGGAETEEEADLEVEIGAVPAAVDSRPPVATTGDRASRESSLSPRPYRPTIPNVEVHRG